MAKYYLSVKQIVRLGLFTALAPACCNTKIIFPSQLIKCYEVVIFIITFFGKHRDFTVIYRDFASLI
jgi:hypothetical protein